MLQSDLNSRFASVKANIDASLTSVRKQYDQSTAGKWHADFTLWARFWYGFVNACHFIYTWTLRPIIKVYWRALKWLGRHYRNLWLHITYKKDQYGTKQFSKLRGGLMILSSVVSLYILYGVLMIAGTLPWYLITVKRNEVLYLSNHSAVEGHGGSKVKINEVYEITGCESIDCSDQDTVSFRVEASFFNEAWSLVHSGALYYPDYVAATVSPVVNKCEITSYGIRKKFLVRNFELHPDILSVRCIPVGLENQKGIVNQDYR